ncbi:MAG: carbohydrate-binding protein [Ruminococcus sp.]|nr:carbohydrate-binding protein [Ruminococcus sp.]
MNKNIRRITALLTGIVTVLGGASAAAPDGRNTLSSADAADRLVAFPGAVGGGKYATGGRGGQVYHVTNLNDSGEGSFRDAVSKSNRIVVFDVGGTIELKSAVSAVSNITIAGQTAPGGGGITLKNYKMAFGGDNIICRYLSSRPGPYNATSSGNDAWGGSKGANCIVDHCSIGWASDEQWGLYSNNSNYTVQYSVIGPANSWGGHDKGIHGFGIMMGNSSLTYDHNLIIHNVSRNFRGKIPGAGVADFTNNIIYDWGYQTAYGTIGHVNYVNNTLKAGNSTTSGYNYINVDSTTSPQNFKVYCAGNRLINKDGSLHGITYNNWDGITVKSGIGITKDNLKTSSPFQILNNGENVSTATTCESAADSYEHVISFAGNGISPDKRTPIDRQCASETKNGTGQCSGTAAYDGSVSDLNKYNIKCGVTYSYPPAVTAKEIVDTDNDGMADSWEQERGLDPTDPTDYAGDYCGQGYMNIEYYINDLTVNSFPEGVVKLSPESDTPAPPPVPAVSAFEKISADSFADQEGVTAEEPSDSENNIGFIENGDWVMYRKVDFGNGARSFSGNVSGNRCVIELYLDSMNGDPAAKIYCTGTGSFTEYRDIEANISEISGIHNLYLKFTGGDGYLLNMRSFVFGEQALPLSGDLFKNVQVTEQALPDSWTIGKMADTGSPIFGDRDFTIEEIQSNLVGSEILMTACSAKGTTGDTVTFTAGLDMTLHIALDSRVEKTPDWLADYTLMRTSLTATTGLIFNIYDKHIIKGTKVTLGSNGQTNLCVNFFALATPDAVPADLIGDVNNDHELGIADLVRLSMHLLGEKPLTVDEASRADLIADSRTDMFDLVALRKAVISQ